MTRRSISTPSSTRSTSRWPTSRRSASPRSRSLRRSTSPSRFRVRAPTSCSAATRSIARPRRRLAARSRGRRARRRAALRRPRARPDRADREHRGRRGPVDRLLAMSGKLDPALRQRLLRGPLAELDGQAARRVVAERAGDVADDPLPATLYIDPQLALVDDMLHYFDRASMAHSLEVRVPFLDHRLVELCATIPGDLKVRRGYHQARLQAGGARPRSRPDHRQAARSASSPARSTAGSPPRPTGAIPRYLLAPEPRYAEFLDRVTVEQLVRRHADGSRHAPRPAAARAPACLRSG